MWNMCTMCTKSLFRRNVWKCERKFVLLQTVSKEIIRISGGNNEKPKLIEKKHLYNMLNINYIQIGGG